MVLILWFFRSLTCASDIIVFFPNLFWRWLYKILSNHFPKQFNKVIPQQLFGFSLSPGLNIWKINTLLQASGKISEWSFFKKIVQFIKHNLILTDCFWCYYCLEFFCFSKISLPLLYFSMKVTLFRDSNVTWSWASEKFLCVSFYAEILPSMFFKKPQKSSFFEVYKFTRLWNIFPSNLFSSFGKSPYTYVKYIGRWKMVCYEF